MAITVFVKEAMGWPPGSYTAPAVMRGLHKAAEAMSRALLAGDEAIGAQLPNLRRQGAGRVLGLAACLQALALARKVPSLRVRRVGAFATRRRKRKSGADCAAQPVQKNGFV